MKFRIALLTATVLAAPLALPHFAKAQPVTGVYVGGGVGYNDEEDLKAKNFVYGNTTPPGDAKISLHGGYTGEASMGYGFGDGFRVELEGDYVDNRFNNVRLPPNTGEKGGGDERKYGAFINVLYDFDIGLPYLYPYLGAGAGWQYQDFRKFVAGPGSVGNKTKGGLGYQAIAGLSFPIAPVPGLSATIEYRFMGLTNNRKFNGDYAGTAVSFRTGREYNNSVLVGARYAFGVAPAPAPAPVAMAAPVAAPAPAPAKTYLVFFDWDKSNLTPRAIDIIAQAASDSHTQQTTTIDVSGYTDTSGTPKYNLGLSERRAQSVAAQLVTDGVSQSEISIHSFGETHLLVQTGPGVREPQNRRVEIVLQ